MKLGNHGEIIWYEDHKEFALTKISENGKTWLVISCGGSYGDRIRVAEHCKALSLKFIDCGISHFQGRLSERLSCKKHKKKINNK